MLSFRSFALPIFLLTVLVGPATGDEKPLIIAHRGASGYLPEHTLAAKAMAYAMGSNFIEQDVVLTKDNQPVILHDIHLDTVTDVSSRFPSRSRKDGRYYVIDFTLAEIRQLRAIERINLKSGLAVFPKRFPLNQSRFSISTLSEEIELIQGLNHSTGRHVGIIPEIKAPAWHHKEGKDLSKIVLSVLAKYGYHDKKDLAYVQCFEPKETQRIRNELGSQLRLVQLIGSNKWKTRTTDFDALRTPAGIQEIATYADAIGPGISHVVKWSPSGERQITPLVQLAHAHGLEVIPYTLRRDSLPKNAKTTEEVLNACLFEAKVDGLFTDFPDIVVDFLRLSPE